MLIQVLVDNKHSWVVPYAHELVNKLLEQQHDARLLHHSKDVSHGDILFLLSCERLFKDLYKNRHNLVIHESALPKGKGWSPLTWQILEGKNTIPMTLFEAAEKVDSGTIYYQDTIQFKGTELLPEMKHLQGLKTIELAMQFITAFPHVPKKEQTGVESFYPKRTAKDSKLDINNTLKKQFNLLRVVDNKRYPAYFELDGQKYRITIEKYDV